MYKLPYFLIYFRNIFWNFVYDLIFQMRECNYWLIYSSIFFKMESLAGPFLLLSIISKFLFVTFISGVLDKVILIDVS